MSRSTLEVADLIVSASMEVVEVAVWSVFGATTQVGFKMICADVVALSVVVAEVSTSGESGIIVTSLIDEEPQSVFGRRSKLKSARDVLVATSVLVALFWESNADSLVDVAVWFISTFALIVDMLDDSLWS